MKEVRRDMDEFYSDSVSDVDMAKRAQKAYFVKKDKVEVWI